MRFRRFLDWLFPSPFDRLLTEARAKGRVSMSQISIGNGRIGWYVSVRPHGIGSGPHEHHYSWTGQSEYLQEAIENAVMEIRDFPIMVAMTESRTAPKLGGAEFDVE